MDQSPDPEARFGDASRRTYFAEERTILAWWRTGISSAGVALAVGAIVPHVTHLSRTRFVALGAGYGVLALFFVIGGNLRAKASDRALAHRNYADFSGLVMTIATCYISVLVILTVVAFL
jgi:putative membrane protein